MKETFRLSIEVELRSAASDALAGHSNTDLDQLRKVLGAYARVIEDTVWLESEQGAFLEFVAQDVQEFSAAIRAEAEAGRWNVAIALLRPLQERSEYVLAAAVDQGFYERYRSRMGRQIETGLKDGSRLLAEDARGTIDRWVRRSKNTEGLLATGRGLNRVASELLTTVSACPGCQPPTTRSAKGSRAWHMAECKPPSHTSCGRSRSWARPTRRPGVPHVKPCDASHMTESPPVDRVAGARYGLMCERRR